LLSVSIGLRRHNHAAGAHHRLGNESGDGVGAFLDDQRVKLGGKPRGKIFLALAVLGKTVMMRAAGVEEAGQRQVEVAMVGRQSGQRSGNDGNAVIALDAADDLLLVRPAERIVEIPDELNLSVVGLRARVAEERL
jgi:hypothetical protein